MQFTYQAAEVTYSNQYNTGGLYIFHFFWNTIMNDIVFETTSGEKMAVTTSGVNVHLYPGQKVRLIIDEAGEIIGFIDQETGQYSYLVRNFMRMYGFGFSLLQAIFLVVILFLFYLLFKDWISRWALYFLIFIPLGIRLCLRVYNFILEKRISRLIEHDNRTWPNV